MKRFLFASLLLPLVLVQACSVDHDVAEDQGSAEGRVAEVAADWCEATCNRLIECPQACDCVDDVCDCPSVGTASECSAACRDFVETFLGHGETCASGGERVMGCIDQAGCEVTSGDVCPLTAAEEAACEDEDDVVSPDGAVACESMGVSGSGLGGEGFRCEVTHSACSDGHDYSSVCSETAEGEGLCTCFVDFQATISYYTDLPVCPGVESVNERCGFAIAWSDAPGGGCQGASGGGPLPGDSEWGCDVEYSDCAGHNYAIRCSDVSGAPACECAVDGDIVSSFAVPDMVCPSAFTDEDLARINEGCGWTLSY
jgi:hypothetical protein